MTIYTVYVLACDGCGSFMHSQEDGEPALYRKQTYLREDMPDRHWHSLGKYHYCPECYAIYRGYLRKCVEKVFQKTDNRSFYLKGEILINGRERNNTIP